MNKLKKIALASAVVFLACAIACMVLLPMVTQSAIALYNEAMAEDPQMSETQLPPEVTKLHLKFLHNGYNAIVRRSSDNFVKISIPENEFFQVELTSFVEGDTAYLEFVEQQTRKITQATLLQGLRAGIPVTIYLPAHVQIVYSNRSHLLERPEHYAEVSEENANIAMISRLRNQLRVETANLEIARLELADTSWDMNYYQSILDPLYSQIADVRSQLVQAADVVFYGKVPNVQMEMLAYRLTELEQSLDFRNAKLAVLQRQLTDSMMSREQYNQGVSAEKQKIAEITPQIEALTKQFDDYILNGDSAIADLPAMQPDVAPVEAPEAPTSSSASSAPQSSTGTESSSQEPVASSSQTATPPPPPAAGEGSSSSSQSSVLV